MKRGQATSTVLLASSVVRNEPVRGEAVLSLFTVLFLKRQTGLDRRGTHTTALRVEWGPLNRKIRLKQGCKGRWRWSYERMYLRRLSWLGGSLGDSVQGRGILVMRNDRRHPM